MTDNKLMSYKRSKSTIDGAISLNFFSLCFSLTIAILIFLFTPMYWQYDSYFGSFNGQYYYSDSIISDIYNDLDTALGVVFSIVAVLHLVSFVLASVALSQRSKEHVYTTFILQILCFIITILGILIGEFFNYYANDYTVSWIYYLIPISLIIFNIISIFLLYKHWSYGRFYIDNCKKVLHEKNRKSFEAYKTAYANGTISRCTYDNALMQIKQNKDYINNNSNFNEKIMSKSKRLKTTIISLLIIVILISFTCISLNIFEKNYLPIMLDKYNSEKVAFEEAKKSYDAISQEKYNNERERNYFNDLFYKNFECNVNGTNFNFIITPNYSTTAKNLSTNLPHSSTNPFTYWDYQFNEDYSELTIDLIYENGVQKTEYTILDKYHHYSYYGSSYYKIMVYCHSNETTYTLYYYY